MTEKGEICGICGLPDAWCPGHDGADAGEASEEPCPICGKTLVKISTGELWCPDNHTPALSDAQEPVGDVAGWLDAIIEAPPKNPRVLLGAIKSARAELTRLSETVSAQHAQLETSRESYRELGKVHEDGRAVCVALRAERDELADLNRELSLIGRNHNAELGEVEAERDAMKANWMAAERVGDALRETVSAKEKEARAAHLNLNGVSKWAKQLKEQTSYLRAERDALQDRYAEEERTVDRVWKALGIATFEQAGGKTIWEIVEALRAERDAAIKECAKEAEDWFSLPPKLRTKKCLLDRIRAHKGEHAR